MWASLYRNQNVRRGIAALALFFVGSFAFDYAFGPLLFPRLLNGLSIAVAISVLLIYSSVIGKALRSEVPDRVELLTLGIATTWLAVLCGRVWFTLMVAGEPAESDFRSSFLTFVLALFCVGGVQHIAASGRLEHSLPTFKLRVVLAACITGAIVFGFYVGRFVPTS